MNILLIDDDQAFTATLKRRLESATSCRVACFAETAQAIESELEHADAILLDMQLGKASGLDAIGLLSQRFTPKHLIMLTGYASIATTVEAMKRGATDYLAKPVSLSDILARINATTNDAPDVEFKPLSPAQIEREHIERVLQANQGNISKTADALNMHRRTLQRKLQKYARGQ